MSEQISTFEIRIQRASDGTWPVVVEWRPGGSIGKVRYDDALNLPEDYVDRFLRPLKLLDYGKILGQALFSGKAGNVQRAFDRAQGAAGARLHVLLHVEDPMLKTLHWERLCAPVSPDEWDFLALDQRVPYSLYLPSTSDRPFPPVGQKDLRALLLVASPEGLTEAGLEPFDAAKTIVSIRRSLGNIPSDVLAVRKDCEDSVGLPTLDSLCEQLTKRHYALLHLVAHGQVSQGETYVYLAASNNQVDVVPGEILITRLRRLQGTLGLPHFAFLATCESAKPEAESGLGGLAQRMVERLGIPAVLAMTDRVSIDTAEALAAKFYVRFRQHGMPDQALVEACAGIMGHADMTVPALYSRLEGRPLFGDSEDKDLTKADVELGLRRVQGLLVERAPVLQEEFDELAHQLRALMPEDGPAWDQGLARANAICDEVLGINFRDLALGAEPPAYDARCPFPGLRAFDEGEHDFFFGRVDLISRLEERLGRHSFLPVLGPSGSGKSSLVVAGLFPALRKKKPELELVKQTPGNDPLARLESAMNTARDRNALLVVDQFEELFTLTRDLQVRRTFVGRLLAHAANQPVIITMRADFLGDCAPLSDLAEALERQMQLVPPMTTAELRQAVEQQAATVGLRFEANLATTILDAVKDEPGAMPLLQHLLSQLWERRHGQWLKASEYLALGGVQRAIAATADGVYDSLSEADKTRMRSIFLRLTQPGDETARDTRRRVEMAELLLVGSDLEAMRHMVQRLADARLVVIAAETAQIDQTDAEVQVAHEALIQHWPRLRGWLDEERANLHLLRAVRQAADDWTKSNNDASYLVHQGTRLDQVLALTKHPGYALSLREQAYVYACVELRESSRLAEARIRVYDRTGDGYPVELAVPGWGEPSFGTMKLDKQSLLQYEMAEDDGRYLGEALFAEEAVGNAYRSLLSVLQRQEGMLQVRLRIDPPELQPVKWERLHHPVDGDWFPLTTGGNTPFSRYFPAQVKMTPHSISEGPLRMLAVLASPKDLAHFNVEPLDTEAIRAELNALPNVSVTYLETGTVALPTLEQLRQNIQAHFDILHVVSHAKKRSGDGRAVLFLETDDGQVSPVAQEEIVDCLRSVYLPPLLCYFLSGASLELGLSVMHDSGVAGCVVMNDLISIDTANQFTAQFYRRLLTHGRADLAMNEARAFVQDRPDWAGPALLSRLPENKVITFIQDFSTTEGQSKRDTTVEVRLMQSGTATGDLAVEVTVQESQESARATSRLEPSDLLAHVFDPAAYGNKLGQTLFGSPPVRAALTNALAVTRERLGRLHLRLRVDIPELQGLKWELMQGPTGELWEALALSPGIDVSRYVRTQHWQRPTRITERPIRMLAIVSAPSYLANFDVGLIAPSETEAVLELLKSLQGIDLTVLASGTNKLPTHSLILQHLINQRYDLIHLFCHSAMRRDSSTEGRIFLDVEGERGTARTTELVDAQRLVRVFRAATNSPVLCCLTVPESLRPTLENATSMFAVSLLQRTGIQAAVAMTGQVGSSASLSFVREFYTSLLKQGAVDVAVTEARIAVSAQGPWNWGAPVLFSRHPNNRIF